VVAEVLDGEHVHLSAETVHLRSQARLPEISLATVYNTLNELVAMGEVLEVSTGAGPKRYDPNVRRPHHHIVCTTCGDVRDVHPSGTGQLHLDDVEQAGFDIDRVDIVFRGRCGACRTGG
jgi:Fe2+ or Zn2+ uptake regulation protein